MRLLQLRNKDELSLTDDLTSSIPPYAILSHTWGHSSEEVNLQDVIEKRGKNKTGYQKILFCGLQAKRDGLEYFWVDTCCIDKASSAELTEAINSMFQWYRKAVHCYVYLSDVSTDSGQASQALRLWDSHFRQSRWFTRGWTLQELLAPTSVQFFSTEGAFLGDRVSLENVIHGITNINILALRGDPLDQFPVLERMHWSSGRQTTKEEDAAYCLLGIFGVNVPLIYGEGKANAMNRLLKMVEERTSIPYVLPRNQPTDWPSSSSLTTSRPIQQAQLLVPFGQNDEFVGRETVLADLVAKILPKAKTNDCQRTVLEGLGGVGKTQIALEAAYRVYGQGSDCCVFWVPAITMVTFENAYRELGEAFGVAGINDDKADIKALVKTALEKSVINWLLVIDNIDDIGLLDNEDLPSYLPFNRKGSILFTTRNHEIAVRLDVSEKNTYTIDEMSEDEAFELVQNGLKQQQYEDARSTRNLLRHLVYLPLAIKQASTYMARTRMTTARYLQLCLASDENQLNLLNIGFEERRRYSKNTNPITMTWLISFQHLAQSYQLAVEYLKFICLLAEKDIPVFLLPPGEDERARDEAIGVLAGYAFIAIREQGGSFDIHRLVRLATRNWIKTEWVACCTAAIQQLAKVYPYPHFENRHIWTRYMPHIQIALHIYKQCTDKEAMASFLFLVGNTYDELGKYREAEEIYRETLELRKSLLGLDHPSTLDSMNNLGLVLDSLGKHEDAEVMHRETLELKKVVLGLDHPLTLDSMNNLALVLDSLGKYGEAEDMHRQELELCKAIRGSDHPSTLDSLSNLALVLDSLGKYEEAEEMHRETLELKKVILGIDHPSTLNSMNNLALVLRSLRKYGEAEDMHRQELELCKAIRGSDHPSTLDSMNNLALVLKSLEKYEEAEEMHRETLELRKVVLGLDHPLTLDSMNNLAIVLDSLGKYGEAEEMHRETLKLRKSVLSLDHPSTLNSMSNLALVLDDLGKYEEAEEMHRETLELKKVVLGLDHPSTLDSMNNLAIGLDSLGKYGEAVEMHRETLELRRSVLGLGHSSTIQSRDNLRKLLDFMDTRFESCSEAPSDDSEGEGGVAL